MLTIALHISGISLLSALSVALLYDAFFGIKQMDFMEKLIIYLLFVCFGSMWVAEIAYLIGIVSCPNLEL